MGHYIKATSIKCHYNFDPDCPMCHGSGDCNDRWKLPCECGLENMTFDKPTDVLMVVEIEPLPDGGAVVHMKDVEQGKN